MSVQHEVLETVRRLCRERGTWTFSPDEVVRALPHLNASTVRTHVVSRCCVNAPRNHPHRWPYFRRRGRGVYEVMAGFRRDTTGGRPGTSSTAAQAAGIERVARRRPGRPPVKETIHGFIVKDGDWYVAECAEIAVVTQGHTIDEAIVNLREAVGLHLEGEESAALGISPSPTLVVTIEIRAADAAA
jgi:predicted RNase H-like HicB family nuclease